MSNRKRLFRGSMLLIIAMVLSIAVMACSSPVSEAKSEDDYSAVFSAEYYQNKYSDLNRVFGSDSKKLFRHFMTFGMKEGRQASEEFDVRIYRANYQDLEKAFGDNLKKYYDHYVIFGKKEGRIANKSLKEETAMKTDTLVVYFSRTGNTKDLAHKMAKYLNADTFEMEAAVPYTDEDIAYYTDCRADREQNDPDARPAIAGKINNMSSYKTVLLGYPIWHGQAPRIINTFLESYDFSGKTIIPFCTSHSSGLGNSDTSLYKLCSDKATWKPGKRFAAGTTERELEKWLQDMGVKPFSKNGNKAVGEFDFENKNVLLNSGYCMPINGIGTYSLLDEVCFNSVKSALKSGVRLIDTAYMYHNEEEVGRAIREAMDEYNIRREDIFVITKLYPGEQFNNPERAIEQALRKLDIGYIDMMLLHHPGNNDVKAYLAMEKYVEEGKIRSLGLSNWYIKELESFLPQINIKPALVQNEIHPYYQESEVVDYIQGLDIVVQGWYPLGGRGYTAELLNNETITKIARAHGVSSAQVILRWNLQNGVVVIPGSSNPDHILENTKLYDFELTDAEMAQMKALNRNEKHDWY